MLKNSEKFANLKWPIQKISTKKRRKLQFIYSSYVALKGRNISAKGVALRTIKFFIKRCRENSIIITKALQSFEKNTAKSSEY